MIQPCAAVASAPTASVPTIATANPARLRSTRKMIVDAAVVAPRQKVMMLPLMVMNVIPIATQPA